MTSDEGTILKLYPLGEYGVIVVICTARHGIIRVAARQARKAGSDFYGKLDLFYEGEHHWTLPKRGDLYSLGATQILRPRLSLRQNLLKLRLASYMARLMLHTVEEHHAQAEWHKLISGALDYVQENAVRVGILTHFEKRLASLHGLYAEGHSAHGALKRHFENLPAGREELMRDLQGEEKG